MPDRIISERVRRSDSLDRLTAEAERLFWRMVTVADDAGRLDAGFQIGLCCDLRVGYPELRVGLVVAAGDAFTAGLDLADVAPRIHNGRLPLVAEGDRVPADARLLPIWLKRAIHPDDLVTWTLPQLVGYGRALRWLYLAEDIPLSVVHEDAHLIVVDKPAGLVVHPAAGNLDGTLVNALLHHCQGQLSGIGGVARPGIVHRIDKDTSGLLVVAKTDAAHEGLAKQFADHSIHRAYRAIVSGTPRPPAGTVRGAIARSSTYRKKMALVEDGRGKHAVTHFRTLEEFKGAALVECRLETGRTHQVRVHMASIGHPLLGDPVYGRNPQRLRPILSQLHFARQALHAAELGFTHPVTGAAHSFAAALPADMAGLLVELGKQS